MRWNLRLSMPTEAALVNLLAAGVTASVAVAAGGLGWRLIGYSGTAPIELPPAASAAPVASPPTSFHPFGRETRSDAIPTTSLPIELRGIIYSASERLAAAYVASPGATPSLFRVGEDVGGGTILGIERSQVLLRVGDRTERLSFPAASGVAGGERAGRPAALNPVPTRRSPGRGGTFGMPAQMTQPAEMTVTRVKAGYLVGGNPPADLRVGDVILEVDGTPTRDEAALDMVLGAARQASTMRFRILRDGKVEQVTVNR